MRRRFTPRRNASRRRVMKTSPRRSRADIVSVARLFAETVNTSRDKVVTVEQLATYFVRCNNFYCRNGDGEVSARSALRCIHEQQHKETSSEESKKESAAEPAQETCSTEELEHFFFRTFSNDPSRIDRLMPVVNAMQKDIKNKERHIYEKEHPESVSHIPEDYDSGDEMFEQAMMEANPNYQTPSKRESKNAATADTREDRIALALEMAAQEQERRIMESRALDEKAAQEREQNRDRAVREANEEQQRRIEASAGSPRRPSIDPSVAEELKSLRAAVDAKQQEGVQKTANGAVAPPAAAEASAGSSNQTGKAKKKMKKKRSKKRNKN